MPAASSIDRWIAALRRPGARVDGTLVNVPGRLTVAAGWDTGARTLPETMVYLIVRGTSAVEAAGRRIAAGPGTCLLIPAGAPFRLRADGPPPTIMRLRLMLPRLDASASRAGAVAVQDAWEIEPVLVAIIDELATSDAHRRERLRALAMLLLTALARLRDAGPAHAGGLTAAQRAALDRLVERSRAHGLQPGELASATGLTLDYFTRRFRRSFGMAPRRWLVRDRVLAAAARLAEGDETLEDAARALGYDDMKLFGRQFRAVMGVPPGRWRLERVAQSSIR